LRYLKPIGIIKANELKPMSFFFISGKKPMSIEDDRFRDLQLHQTDAALGVWKQALLPPVPPFGWAKAIREALGMSAAAMARRLGVTHAGVRRLEQAEAQGAITLASLRKLAAVLDCELQYALVPRTSLSQELQDRAAQVAGERLRPISHSMSLEDQSVAGPMSEVQRDLLAKELLQGPRRELW
jgi:predicted DNA-binding mobile mystery protein A